MVKANISSSFSSSSSIFLQALERLGKAPEMKTYIDCISSHRTALAGGVTLIGAMPNTNPAIVDKESLALAQKVRREGSEGERWSWGRE